MESQSLKKGEVLIPTPRWFIGLRVAQIIVSLIIVALAGAFIHGAYADSLGVAIATGIFTWIIALYAILTEHATACRRGYNTWAVLSLDAFMIILWLATLGSNAAFRTSFDTQVNAACYDDGSAINSGHCIISRKVYVANKEGLGWLSGVAGISAVMLLLFIATFAYVAHFFRLEWARQSTGTDAEKASGVAAPVAAPAAPVEQSQPFLNQQQQYGQQQEHAQWTQPQQQQQHQPSPYAPQNIPYDPYTQQNTGYTGAQGAYNPPVSHELPSPQGTPAPGQPYYPPH